MDLYAIYMGTVPYRIYVDKSMAELVVNSFKGMYGSDDVELRQVKLVNGVIIL